ncbi:hypothetical protein RRU94_13665 [Domibacillus sp. DTU_2020_1001157_1_SI_ALB_TIR_016]|uniref:hypothetical protein n=1 Tax=Domibacillus sp. DTU_2020_1001157_1_SI_ALB_TIR_016 TaxID=3077789 RepID=UPI0028F139C5|nr:hypothetical protein [Domibacillus sp. DTU_2020_1001157_1_SI_ALB_TIR_016]WNS81805.1 hypothetical protein RRU94_13665 [Domibacillus sp. DTU_2020_1001157_1_SI_ALB_TIR_016]
MLRRVVSGAVCSMIGMILFILLFNPLLANAEQAESSGVAGNETLISTEAYERIEASSVSMPAEPIYMASYNSWPVMKLFTISGEPLEDERGNKKIQVDEDVLVWLENVDHTKNWTYEFKKNNGPDNRSFTPFSPEDPILLYKSGSNKVTIRIKDAEGKMIHEYSEEEVIIHNHKKAQASMYIQITPDGMELLEKDSQPFQVEVLANKRKIASENWVYTVESAEYGVIDVQNITQTAGIIVAHKPGQAFVNVSLEDFPDVTDQLSVSVADYAELQGVQFSEDFYDITHETLIDLESLILINPSHAPDVSYTFETDNDDIAEVVNKSGKSYLRVKENTGGQTTVTVTAVQSRTLSDGRKERIEKTAQADFIAREFIELERVSFTQKKYDLDEMVPPFESLVKIYPSNATDVQLEFTMQNNQNFELNYSETEGYTLQPKESQKGQAVIRVTATQPASGGKTTNKHDNAVIVNENESLQEDENTVIQGRW